jgi:hypothetical protein
MKIHSTDLTYEAYPKVMPLLETPVFMWLILFITLGIMFFVLKKLWNVHSIPKHLAKERGYSQAKLVFWLCILGLAWKPLWIAAVLMMVVDWTALQNWFRESVTPIEPEELHDVWLDEVLEEKER